MQLGKINLNDKENEIFACHTHTSKPLNQA
jgi:hypothetical protein